MTDNILQTIKALIYENLPKNGNYCYLLGHKVDHWITGDQTILPSGIGINIYSGNNKEDDFVYGAKDNTHNIVVKLWAASNTQMASESLILEGARIIKKLLLEHRIIWVLEKCPFCNKKPLTPLHYINYGMVDEITITNPGIGLTEPPAVTFTAAPLCGFTTAFTATGESIIRNGKLYSVKITSPGLGYTNFTPSITFGTSETVTATVGISDYTQGHLNQFRPYLNNIINDFHTYWYLTNTSAPPMPSLEGLAAQSLINMIYDIDGTTGTNVGVALTSYFPGMGLTNLRSLANDKSSGIIILYDVNASDITPSNEEKEQSLLKMATFNLTAKELISQPIFGPNNVPIDAI